MKKYTKNEIQEAVDIVFGDDGFMGNKVIEILNKI